MNPQGFLALPDNWDSELEHQLLRCQTEIKRRKVYICSPLRADTADGVLGNMMAVRYYMYYAYKNMGVLPCAPHAYLPVMLSDHTLRERALALKFGRELLAVTGEILVCGHILSDGMRGELDKAVKLEIPITVFSPGLYSDVVSFVGDKWVRYNDEHVALVLNAGELFKF